MPLQWWSLTFLKPVSYTYVWKDILIQVTRKETYIIKRT